MELSQYKQYFYRVKLKIEQALRLQSKLEERSQALLMVLPNLDDTRKIEPNLRDLSDIHKRKLRILSICNLGLQDATKNLAQFERQINASENVATKIKIRIPLLIKYGDYETQILLALHRAFSGINLQINYANYVSAELNAVINEEYSLIDSMLKRIQLGAFDFPEYKKFLDRLSWLHNAEKDIINGIKKRNNHDSISSIFIRMEDCQNRLQEIASKYPIKRVLLDTVRKHPRIAAFQAAWAYVPDVSIGSGYVIYNFGFVYMPVFVAICYLIEWSPSLIALGIEINKYRKSRK